MKKLTMEQIKKLVNRGNTMLASPYAAIIMGIILISYLGYVAHKLPESYKVVLENPLSKVLIFFIILGLHRMKPILSLVVVIVVMILLPVLSVRDWMKPVKLVPMRQHKAIPDDEASQIALEVENELHPKHESSDRVIQHQMEQSQPVESPEMVTLKTSDGLHPLNRPTEMTLLTNQRIEDPDNLQHPGWEVLKDPHVNVAIYELNPPYARKDTVEDGSHSVINKSSINVPAGGPTRYSASHGYSLS